MSQIIKSLKDFFGEHNPNNISKLIDKNKSLMTYGSVGLMIIGVLNNIGWVTGLGISLLIIPYLLVELNNIHNPQNTPNKNNNKTSLIVSNELKPTIKLLNNDDNNILKTTILRPVIKDKEDK